MLFDELIFQRFCQSAELAKILAGCAGGPAVFTPDVPGDDEAGWEGNLPKDRLQF